jgi:hypothetical protein
MCWHLVQILALRNVCTLADLKMDRLLDSIDAWETANGLDHEVDPPHRFPYAVGATAEPGKVAPPK